MERPAPLAVLPFSDPAHALSLLRGLSQLRAERKFLDVTLEAAGGRDFPAHRAVLAAASPYFRAMFAGQLRESRAERVRLHGVPPDMLQLLLDFSYTGRVAVSGDNAEPLLRAADLLQFPAVKEACGTFLQQQLDLANCLDMQDFAEAFSCAGLASAAQRFILRHVGELGAEQLERLPLARLLRYLRDDGLCVPKEEAAYQLALRWVRADPPRRAAHWPQLLEAVRLPFVRRFYLLAHVEAEPLVARCPPCLRLLREARDFQAARYDRHDRGPCPRMRPRPSTGLAEILVLVGGCDQDCDELVTVDCYNPQTGQWRYLAEFPDHLGGGYSIVALGNDIYVTGGSDGSRLYDCVWRYNSSVNEWTEVAPMLKAREYHSSSVLDGLLYVVAADSTERYDHTTDSWEALQPMTYPMDNCSTTACRGRLYAIGSLAGKETMVMQCYHPDTDLWSLVDCGQLPPWSFAPKTVTLNGLMYFVRDDSAEVDVYNPVKNEWDKIPSMNQVHVGGSLAVLGGKLYVSGGYDNTFELSDVVEAYDPEARAWSVVGRLPEPTFWHGSVSIFRQFMPQTPLGGRGFDLDSGSNVVDAGRFRPLRNPEELH
ncbi:kelch like family member 21, transcript variant X1 [Ictidomys tridecemlineatus]|uniref:Kelch-like protein 21 n=1 Tax=Ictidomys tridecemlineatus TaxID=43179 RepID=I3N661_ICTTR|nr:kelch-like protein 21 isoform X1 [Ictidomys tridecemlineatus]KAG3282027.1 kelch like family member 21, transcript variant X1 [Ictidomys tridecemlineatus]